MREVTLFLHSQKIQRPEPVLSVAMARLATGMRSDYRLAMDVRRFESDYQGGALPVATIEISATLIGPWVGPDGRENASRADPAPRVSECRFDEGTIIRGGPGFADGGDPRAWPVTRFRSLGGGANSPGTAGWRQPPPADKTAPSQIRVPGSG